MSRSHLELDTAWDVFSKIFDSTPVKIAGSLIAVFMAQIFNGETQVLFSLYFLILLDLSTALIYAVRTQQVTSRGFFRTAMKCLVYFIMLVVARVVDNHVPIKFAAPIMDTFLIMTEALSILENLNKLGWPVPTKLVKMLKDKKGDK